MILYTKEFREEHPNLDPEIQRELLEHHEFAEGLAKGSIDIPEELCKELKKLNRVPYDKNYDDTRCHGCEVNKRFGCVCPYQNGNTCQLRVMLKQPPKVVLGTEYRLMPGVCIDLPKGYKAKVAKLLCPEARCDILRLYDWHFALAVDISRVKSLVEQNALEQPEVQAYLASLNAKKDAIDRELSGFFDYTYQLAKRGAFGPNAPSDEKLRDVYEVAQYRKRIEKGEPAVFENKRCLFDGFVISQGYLPGPLAGLEFWKIKDGPVDPRQFSKWLADTKNERERSKFPPVGYTGCPACSIYALDILKYFSHNYGVIGYETFGVMTQTPRFFA